MVRDYEALILRLQEYVRARLRQELADGSRGSSARLAEEFGVSTAFISNLTKTPHTRSVGEATCRMAAEHWRITYADLERLALGLPVEVKGPTYISMAAPELREQLREILVEVATETAAAAADKANADAKAKAKAKAKAGRKPSGEHKLGPLLLPPHKKKPASGDGES